ncbi:MAG: hypothetical protein LUC26_06955 [Prevotella sp.]|nr:hypothetical protein [Prevotella sp.]
MGINAVEKWVYNRVKNNYKLKNFMRDIYQGINDLRPDYPSWFAAKPIVVANKFFGFHDCDPFNAGCTKLLACEPTIPLRMPAAEDKLNIGYLSGENFGEWHKIAETRAWNYHKGCRLQWLGSDKIIFNSERSGVLCAIVSDTAGKTLKTINWPIDTASGDGRFATTFSYERLQKMMPGYGYAFGDADSLLGANAPGGTGLWLVDLAKNTREMLVGLEALAQFRHEPSMDGRFHFVTHTEFSRDNRFVAFLHRWYHGVEHHTRLIVIDLETREMYASPTSGMVSHYAWNGAGGIAAYCSIGGIDSHVYFHNPQMSEWHRVAYPQLNTDGHHHFLDDAHFVVDTYPDKRRHAKIYKVGVEHSEIQLLADVKSPKRFSSGKLENNWRCDLHPRCSSDGRYLCFDSVFTGVRSLCVMDLRSAANQ